MITANEPIRKLELYEILELVGKTKSRKEKIEILRKHESMPLKDYLRCVFDDAIQLNLPGGKPPFQMCREESVPSSWSKQHQKLKYFVKGLRVSDDLPAVKRESMFIGVLESIHPRDADVVVDMANKKSGAAGLTKKLVQEAFPKLIAQ